MIEVAVSWPISPSPQTRYNSRRDAETIGPLPLVSLLPKTMPNFDPSFLPPPPVRRESKIFTTSDGSEFSLCAEVSEGGDFDYALVDAHQSNLEKWGAGVPQPGAPSIKITSTTCWLITRILLAVVPSEGEDQASLWTFVHWATLLSRDRACFNEVSSWVGSLTHPEPEEDDSGNPTPAPPSA
jgi:hypothetical protein